MFAYLVRNKYIFLKKVVIPILLISFSYIFSEIKFFWMSSDNSVMHCARANKVVKKDGEYISAFLPISCDSIQARSDLYSIADLTGCFYCVETGAYGVARCRTIYTITGIRRVLVYPEVFRYEERVRDAMLPRDLVLDINGFVGSGVEERKGDD